MAKANLKIYPLPIITESAFNGFSDGLKKLEERTATSVSYNFEERCFEITANDQNCCHQAETLIIQNLLPRLNEEIDSDYMLGTYHDLSMFETTFDDNEPMSSPIPTNLPPKFTFPGKPLAIDHDEDQHDDDDDDEDEQNDEQNQDQDSGSLVIETFTISPEIRNIDDFLIGPVQHNMQNAVYLKLIPKMTDTICTLNGRSIKIEGAPDDVKAAYQKFAVIQKTHIGLSKKILVPCLHFHNAKNFRLYFCNLPRYRHHSFVHHHYEQYESPADYHIVLPVFLDKRTDEYSPPKDLVMTNMQYSSNSNSRRRSNSHSNRINEINRTMTMVQNAMQRSIIHDTPSSSSSSRSHTSHPTPTLTPTPADPDSFQPPLWGLDRNFTSAYNTGELDYIPSERLLNAFTPAQPLQTAPEPHMLKDFRLLQTDIQRVNKKPKDYKPSLLESMPKPRRVLRIAPQKASSTASSPTPSLDQMERIKTYNYNNIKHTLSKGLESVRGFKGELKLHAKIGKVLWSVKSKEVLTRIWEFDQLIDIVVREYGTIPKFTNMTTKDERIIDLLASDQIIQGARLLSKTAIYEFHCNARNSPSLPYKPVVIHMNQGVIDVRKVVVSEQTVAEVDWVSLDRRFDFKLALNAKQLIRCDVKPYTSFNKWVSVCPITRQMSFENVDNFLEVDHVLFKQTKRYSYKFPFIIEIIRVEKVPLCPQPNSNKINAYPGRGEEAWYDFEIYNSFHDAPFKSNLNLELGAEASWKVQDILQSDNSANDTITNYVKNMIMIIEKVEKALSQIPH